MANFNQNPPKFRDKAPEVRERRLETGIAFAGTCNDIRCAQRSGCINAANRSFSQTHGCQFTLSLGMLNSLRNAVVIMHGPIGCGACTIGSVGTSQTFRRLRDPLAEGVVWLNTNLDESDVIAGGEKKLRESILYADKEFRPETIIVPISCVPSLIGDDVDNILDNLQSETAAILIPIHCAGFKTKIMASAYDDVYHGILRGLVRPPVRKIDSNIIPDENYIFKKKYRDEHTVNILNVGSMSRPDELELERLLNAIGLYVRFLPCYSAAEDFRYMTESALNVSVCGTHDDFFIENVYNLFGIPYIIDVMPVGKKNTSRWLLKIAEHFGFEKDAQKFIDSEEREINEALDQFRPTLKGKRVYIAGGEVRILATAEVVQDLGMEVVGFKGHHYDKFSEPLFDNLENIDDVPYNAATQQPFEQINIVKKLNPDLYIGHTGTGNISVKQGVATFPLYGPANNYMGYSGVFEIARRINKALKNWQYCKKITEHCPLPYRKEYLEGDPFKYIKENG
ncbi:MAG: hypothetical protein LBT51_03425 [Fusobacteriaceae bacterium]|jgi:nitrogenase molybdenum-iron protein alpha chain|nr:hypothetical protein [Fusobacteriaceae bacterium]